MATLAIFKTTSGSQSIVPKIMGQAAKSGDYLAEWLGAVAMLVYKSLPTVVAVFDIIPNGEESRQRRPRKTLLL